jgi:hypothetical protein
VSLAFFVRRFSQHQGESCGMAIDQIQEGGENLRWESACLARGAQDLVLGYGKIS